MFKELIDEFIKDAGIEEKDKAAFFKAMQENLPDVDKKIIDKIHKEYTAECRAIAESL